MSANDDDIPWVPQILDLIRHAHGRNVPMLGHCLGAQLIARALGGMVTRSPAEEIGWLPVDVIANGNTRSWSDGLPPTLNVFHWHNETFSLPPGARKVFHRETCPNQGFQIGSTLALQFHLEVLPETVHEWAAVHLEPTPIDCDTVQSRQSMIEDLPEKAAEAQRAADHIYGHWLTALA